MPRPGNPAVVAGPARPERLQGRVMTRPCNFPAWPGRARPYGVVCFAARGTGLVLPGSTHVESATTNHSS